MIILVVSERWKMRDGRIAIVTHRDGTTCAGQIEGSDLAHLWVAGKDSSSRRFDLMEQQENKEMTQELGRETDDQDTKLTCDWPLYSGNGVRLQHSCGNDLEQAQCCEHLHCPDHTPELHLALGVCGREECAIAQAGKLMRGVWGKA